MATAKPPFVELGNPMAAVFRVGRFQEHPEIPDCLSVVAHEVLTRCFEPDPEKRITAVQLLEHPFLVKPGKQSKEIQRSISMVPPNKLGLSDDASVRKTAYGGAVKTEPVKALSPVTVANGYLNGDGEVAEEQGSDGETPSNDSLAEFKQVKMYAHNQIILTRVLTEERKQICEDLLKNIKEACEYQKHILTESDVAEALNALIAFIRHENREEIQTSLEGLQSKCRSSTQMWSEVERLVTHFPIVIREANKRQDTAPHCMFAIEELVGKALSGLKQVLLPGSGNSPSKSALRQPDTPTKPHPPTKTVSWASDSFEEGELTDSQLRKRLEEYTTDNLALLRELLKSRQELNELLHQSVAKQQLLLENAQLTAARRSKVAIAEALDPELKVWLEGCGVDKATMNKFAMEEVTLSDVQNHLTREDLVDMKLLIGPRCRIWSKIVEHRKRSTTV